MSMRFFSTGRGRDLLIIGLLLALPLVLFSAQTLGGRTLIPAENLYQYPPYSADREALGVPSVPHNHLVSDLILQNYQWKSFIRMQISAGEFPLWNPHQFSGIAFFAAGQQSTLYPLSLLYYVMPLASAYGWFTVVTLWMAGVFMFAFTRGIGVGRTGSAVAGVTYQLSAFFVISAVFPMIIASAVWLPLILLMIHWLIVKPKHAPIWIGIGAIALGCNILAGHVEITYYTLIIAAYYAAARLILLLIRDRQLMPVIRHGAAMAVMVGIGIALGAVQFVPLFEAASNNFRSDSTTFQQVLDWAHPFRDVVQFALPNFYGNPSHHSIFDVFTGQTIPLMVNALGEARFHTEWGIKNYVEAALYIGILPLILSVYGVIGRTTTFTAEDEGLELQRTPRTQSEKLIFLILGLFSLTVMFGLPTYAILYYTLPGIDQLHSPFRWVFGVTLSIAVLAGFGADKLFAASPRPTTSSPPTPLQPSVREGNKARLTPPLYRLRWREGWGVRIGFILIALGSLILIGLITSRVLYDQVTADVITRVFESMALATTGFPDARTFYSYQVMNVGIFALVLIGSGVVFLTRWRLFAVLLIAADLMIASYSFNPASDPAWLDHTPASIAWLQDQPGEWRYITYEDQTQSGAQTFNANMTLRYGLDDVRGYESIIPLSYVDFMRGLAPQVQLDFNRVAPIYAYYPAEMNFDPRAALESETLDLLNVRFVITQTTTDLAALDYALAYEDSAVRIWENPGWHERAWFGETPVEITPVSAREWLFTVSAPETGTLIISQSYDSGWRAFIRPAGGTEDDESPLTVEPYLGALQQVTLPEAGAWTVRLVYSPQSLYVGGVISFLGGVIVVLLFGVWLWRQMVNPSDAQTGGVHVIARNSLVPILLNLFNRGVDMAFALIMLRILGPADAGLYFYAGVVFVWFDIFTNFGLNLFLIREAARDRSKAAHIFLNTSALRVVLIGVCVPLLIAFLTIRQSAADPLPAYAITAIALLYLGLLPNSLSNGLSALFYAYERAEVPAAVATTATILKTAGGLAALLFGAGIIGLAAVSIGVNTITLALLWLNSPLRAREKGINAKAQRRKDAKNVDPKLIRGMVRESYPLMLNHFLATIFFQVDVILIEWIHNPTMVGQYSVAYKWISALNVIPAFFTQALLPGMSRQAHEDKQALKRTVTMALKLLMSVALPIAVIFTFTSYALAGLLGGAAYLPESAIATQLMIWSIPIGWMNSLTQYVLIALDLQKRITRAFVAAVGFNLITNLLLIPTYGYVAAAIITAFSELTLLIAFSILMRPAFGWINWGSIAAKPLIAAAAMFGVLLLGFESMPMLALIAAAAVYVVVLYVLRPLNTDELARLAPLIPQRFRRVLAN